ncbi:hypothetical protein PR048_000928 [Dryococelus australis]|uniref:Uncharacterized protein n=1 Tax=Dryococelus australis TaxID=614101 RepID=A0ABQ9IFZ9_9NEOP|nr:hypothetical protein PR048_000928 [Dryococelus australis]
MIFRSSHLVYVRRIAARVSVLNKIRASQKQCTDFHKTPYDGVKRCRERKINIKAFERINVDVFTQNKRPCLQHSHTQFLSSLGIVEQVVTKPMRSSHGGGHGGRAVSLPVSPPRRYGFNPRPGHSDSRMWESCRMMPLDGWFFRGSPVPQRLSYLANHISPQQIFSSLVALGICLQVGLARASSKSNATTPNVSLCRPARVSWSLHGRRGVLSTRAEVRMLTGAKFPPSETRTLLRSTVYIYVVRLIVFVAKPSIEVECGREVRTALNSGVLRADEGGAKVRMEQRGNAREDGDWRSSRKPSEQWHLSEKRWGRGGVVDRLLSSHLGEPGSISVGVAIGFSHVVILLPDDAAGRQVFLGVLPSPPPPRFPALIHTHLTSLSLALKTSIDVKTARQLNAINIKGKKNTKKLHGSPITIPRFQDSDMQNNSTEAISLENFDQRWCTFTDLMQPMVYPVYLIAGNEPWTTLETTLKDVKQLVHKRYVPVQMIVYRMYETKSIKRIFQAAEFGYVPCRTFLDPYPMWCHL